MAEMNFSEEQMREFCKEVFSQQETVTRQKENLTMSVK